MSQKPTKFFPFYLGIRIALVSGCLLALILFLAARPLFGLTFGQSAALAAFSGLAGVTTIYVTVWIMQKRRIDTAIRISRNIARKRFEEYDLEGAGHRDELDYLITHSMRASKTMEREIQRLNKIENYRKEFIGDISHELKTPIFAIQGFLETLMDGALEDPSVNRKFLGKAMRNVNRLNYLTKDLMEISRLETGELKSDIQKINLHYVIHDVVEGLQLKAQKEGVKIRLRDLDHHLTVLADRNQIKQVLVNLIENAMKYNRPGGYIEIGVKEYQREPHKILLYVKDSGIGIDPEHLPRITERFYRVDKSRSREKGGTGLGLSIVKHILESHGEKLFLESVPNQGTTFSFTLSLPLPD